MFFFFLCIIFIIMVAFAFHLQNSSLHWSDKIRGKVRIHKFKKIPSCSARPVLLRTTWTSSCMIITVFFFMISFASTSATVFLNLAIHHRNWRPEANMFLNFQQKTFCSPDSSFDLRIKFKLVNAILTHFHDIIVYLWSGL